MRCVKEKYKFWVIGIVVGCILLTINSFINRPKSPKESGESTEILVNAPESMHEAFQTTLKDLRLTDDYVLKFTDSKNANFTVTEGPEADGQLIAYSPFVAVFNSDEDLEQQRIKEEIFVQSKSDSNYNDFNFKKVIDNIVSGSDTSLKVYYPAKDSVYWDEFYSFLLFIVNDGYYPKNESDMANAQDVIEKFLNSKNAEPIDTTAMRRNNGIPKDSVYFMTYVDLANLYEATGLKNYKLFYPTSVVYHNYYAKFDKTGELLFNFLSQTGKGLFGYENTGYLNLKYRYFHTLYTNSTNYFDRYSGVRDTFNGVEIPKTNVTVNNDIKEEEQK